MFTGLKSALIENDLVSDLTNIFFSKNLRIESLLTFYYRIKFLNIGSAREHLLFNPIIIENTPICNDLRLFQFSTKILTDGYAFVFYHLKSLINVIHIIALRFV